MATQWQVLRRDFSTSLQAEGKSPNTLRLYLGAVDKLAKWVEANAGPADPRQLTRTDLALFMAAMSKEWKPSTCSLNYRALQQFFGWLVREDRIDRSPMERMRPPSVPEQPVAVLTDDQLRTLLTACDGRDFVDRRDMAIIRMFLDTGCRRGEIAGLTTADVSLEERDITVIGKGSRVRIIPFGLKTAQALGRYLRLREGSGLSDEARAAAGGVLSIAQFGSTRPINAGVAAGIAMHAWIRQHAEPGIAAPGSS
jgi:integrase/recombinase XerC